MMEKVLLGRMLYEAQLLFDDQVENLKKDSERIGTQGKEIDFALLVDGLSAEREQGITIDVAYRFLAQKKENLLSQTPQDMSNIQEIWLLQHLMQTQQ